MQHHRSAFLRCALTGLVIFIAGCAGVGSTLKRGESTLTDVVASMGEPAMRWQDPDGRQQLAFPKGPAGTETFMAFFSPEGRLERFEGVLDFQHFARIEIGKSDQASVLRLLGPSSPYETQYFDRRNELVWEWRFCNSLGQQAFFGVLFDATTGVVRSTHQRPEILPTWNGSVIPSCGSWIISVH